MLNIALPSIVIKMMRQKFDQQWSVRKTTTTHAEQTRVLRLLKPGTLSLEARLEGPRLRVRDFLGLEEGNLLAFDYPVDRPIELAVNGARKYTARIVSTGKKRAAVVEEIRVLERHGRSSIDEAAGGASSRV